MLDLNFAWFEFLHTPACFGADEVINSVLFEITLGSVCAPTRACLSRMLLKRNALGSILSKLRDQFEHELCLTSVCLV